MAVIHIQLDDPQAASLEDEMIRRAAAAALDAAPTAGEYELTIVLTGAEELRRLNAKYRNIDQPTDVLAFPDGSVNLESNLTYLGDVVIAVPIAARQANEGGHRLEDEIQLVVVHGILHLLGFDHTEEASKTEMWQAQERALTGLGSPIRSEDWA